MEENTESEEEKKENELIKIKIDIIRQNPYEFICKYAESLYPHVGDRVFRIICLMPCSLMIPDIPYSNKTIRSNINCLFLAPSGAGKTSVSKLFSALTINPLEVESITPAKLEFVIEQTPKFSLIVGDFARMSRDPTIIKIIEGLLGEEKSLKRKTMQKDVDIQTEGIGLVCGTPQDLSHYLSGGLLFRLCPRIILTNPSNHSAIGQHIKNKIGEEGDGDITEMAIQLYYRELERIQDTENHPKRVTGYVIEQRFKDSAYEVWQKLTNQMVAETNMNFFRGLHEFFRILISHAFLNVHNRKVVNGKLYPNEQDFHVAINLMSEIIEIQYDILKTERFIRALRNLDELNKVMKNPKVKEKYKEIIKNLAIVNKGKVQVK